MNDCDKYYNILNLSKNATLNDIKKAYRQLSIKYHPDKNNNCDSSQFNKISEAYIQLTNNFNSIQNNESYYSNCNNEIIINDLYKKLNINDNNSNNTK